MVIPFVQTTPQTRLEIIDRIVEASTGKANTYAVIKLPSGDELLMQASFGRVWFGLMRRGGDLFDQLVDVSELVKADMEANRDWVRVGARS